MPKIKYQKTVISWVTLLTSIIDKNYKGVVPDNFTFTLVDQHRFAKWEDKDRDIYKSTLNTLKSAAKEIPQETFECSTNFPIELKTGWDKLNYLRLEAIKSLSSPSEIQEIEKPNKSTKAGLKLTVDLLENRVSILEAHNMRLTSLLSTWIGKTKKYADKADTETKELFKKEISELRQRLTWSNEQQELTATDES